MMLKSPSQGRRGRKFAVRALMLAAVLAGAYYGVPLIRDYWLLWQLETEYSELQTFAQKKAERSQDPQFFRDWGDGAIAFWHRSGKGIRVATERQEAALAWTWMAQKPEVLGEGVAAYREALRLDPQMLGVYGGLCAGLLQQDDIDGAIAACRQAAAEEPQEALHSLRLGFALSGAGRWSEAEAVAREALRLAPKNDDAHYLLGNVLLAQDQAVAAEQAYRQSIALAPEANLTYLGLGDALLAQNKVEEAIAAYRKSIEVVPQYPPAYQSLAAALARQGDQDGAIAAYREAIAAFPFYSEAYADLGQLLVQKNQLEEAIALYRQGLERDPQAVEMHYLLGEALAAQQRWPEAIAAYQQALKLDPQHPSARQRLQAAQQRATAAESP